jgi:hypothetical protein
VAAWGVQGDEGLCGHVGLGRWGDEADLGRDHGGKVGVGDKLGVPDQQQPPPAREFLERGHRPHDLGDLPGAAVIGPVEHRHGTITCDRQARLDLLQIGPAVLGVAVVGHDEPLLGLGIGPIQRDRRKVPVQPGHIQPEHTDRSRADRPHDLLQLLGDRVQRAAHAVIVERGRVDPPDLPHGPLLGPVLDVNQRRR